MQEEKALFARGKAVLESALNKSNFAKKNSIIGKIVLGWVDLLDFDFGSSDICPIMLRLMGIWQNWLGSWATPWNILIKVNPTRV